MQVSESPFEESIGRLIAAQELPKPNPEVVAYLDIGCWGLEHLSTTLAINTRPRLVGRELESVRLLHALDAVAREGAAVAVTIAGEAGSGKTRLIEETLTIAKVGGFEGRAFSVTAEPADASNATIARLIRARFGLDDVKPQHRRSHLLRQVGELFADERVEDVCYFLGKLVGLSFEPTPLTRMLAEHEFQNEVALQCILCELFAADSEQRPLCVVIEDLHHVDRDSLGKLMALVDDLRPGSLMICSARPEFFARHEHFAAMGSGQHEHIELCPLEADDVRLLLKNLVGPCANDELGFESFFLGTSLGNPGLIQELVRELWAVGALQPLSDQSGCYFDAASLSSRPELASIGKRSEHRGSALSPLLLGLLEAAAVVGPVSWQGLCATVARTLYPNLSERDPRSIELAFARLELDGYLLRLPDSRIAGEVELVFKDAELREELASQSRRNKRRAAHRVIADWLLRNDSSLRHGSDLCALTARHLKLSGSSFRAAELLLQAASVAQQHEEDNLAAAGHYYAALEELSDHDNRRRIGALEQYGSVLVELGQPAHARLVFQEMQELAERLNLPAKQATALNQLGRIHRETGDLSHAQRLLERALGVFEQAGDAHGASSAKADLGSVQWLRGETDQAQQLLRAALEEKKRLGDERAVAAQLAQLALVWNDLGKLTRSEQALTLANQVFEQKDDLRGRSDTLLALGVAAARRDDLPRALSLAHSAAQLAHRAKDRPRVARCLISLGVLRLKNRDLDEAQTLLERGTRLAAQIEAFRDLGDGQRALAKLAMWRGAVSDAAAHAYAAVRLARRIRSRSQLGAALRVCAEIASRATSSSGNGDRAARLYLRSIAIVKRIGQERELAKTYRAFARHAERYESAAVQQKAQQLRDISAAMLERCAARDAA